MSESSNYNKKGKLQLVSTLFDFSVAAITIFPHVTQFTLARSHQRIILSLSFSLSLHQLQSHSFSSLSFSKSLLQSFLCCDSDTFCCNLLLHSTFIHSGTRQPPSSSPTFLTSRLVNRVEPGEQRCINILANTEHTRNNLNGRDFHPPKVSFLQNKIKRIVYWTSIQERFEISGYTKTLIEKTK